jgi:hypothetical protein
MSCQPKGAKRGYTQYRIRDSRFSGSLEVEASKSSYDTVQNAVVNKAGARRSRATRRRPCWEEHQ